MVGFRDPIEVATATPAPVVGPAMKMYGGDVYLTVLADSKESAINVLLAMTHGHLPFKDASGDGFLKEDSVQLHETF